MAATSQARGFGRCLTGIATKHGSSFRAALHFHRPVRAPVAADVGALHDFGETAARRPFFFASIMLRFVCPFMIPKTCFFWRALIQIRRQRGIIIDIDVNAIHRIQTSII